MSASVRLMIQGHSARRVTSRVRQCHQLIKISEIKSEQIHQDTCILGASLVSHWIHIKIHQETCILDSSS